MYSDMINRDRDDDDDDFDEDEDDDGGGGGGDAALFADEREQKRLEELHTKMQNAEELFGIFHSLEMNGPAFKGEAFGMPEKRAEKRAERLKKEADEEEREEKERKKEVQQRRQRDATGLVVAAAAHRGPSVVFFELIMASRPRSHVHVELPSI